MTEQQLTAMRQALNKAFQLGQRYWCWADSEYSSHWKKADAAKAEFDKLVEDTLRTAIEQAEKQQALDRKAENARELGLDYEPEERYTYGTPLLDAFTKPAPVQGCDFCNHPLYAGTKCKNCGREAAAQEEIQRLSALVRAQQITIDKLEAKLREKNAGETK